jgi:uncharacterized protein (TIGR01370 family)
VALLAALLLGAGPDTPVRGLSDVRTYMYQFQRTEVPTAVEALAGSSYDLLIVEPLCTYRSGQDADAPALVRRLRGSKPVRLVFAYLNLSEADRHRTYWESSWKEPARDKRGKPDFLVAPDPDGWEDTYLVCYWDPRWQELLLADLRRILKAGYDGLCLDWTDAFEQTSLAAQARVEGKNAAREMVDLLARLRAAALEINPHAMLLLQNPAGLQTEDPRVTPLADAALYENTWYSGKAEVSWSDARGGDREALSAGRRENRLSQMERWKKDGKPVFTLDYCLKPEHARQVYEAAKERGLVPLVSRSALDRLTETPPAWLP